MTTAEAPQTKEEFAEQLELLIQRTESNGVDIEGGYMSQSENGGHDWDVEIFPVVKGDSKH